jgi:hypothetical protein
MTDYERLPGDGDLDETDVALRAYLASRSEDHLRACNPAWTDDELMTWDGNFRSDGALMLVCCERDVDATEFREVLERHLDARLPNWRDG